LKHGTSSKVRRTDTPFRYKLQMENAMNHVSPRVVN
jgi:hypothetical protein